ncbi:hypothetical protein BC834DRAFT_975824 [Gloeopeniophorella convolvens]|nr:hypothetical protein BC834DRAFT_975824 [Gloeopeniophorella convolvens]
MLSDQRLTSEIRGGQYLTAIGMAILYYDHLLNLGDEVKFMWMRPMTKMKLLFIFHRYLANLACVHIFFGFSGLIRAPRDVEEEREPGESLESYLNRMTHLQKLRDRRQKVAEQFAQPTNLPENTGGPTNNESATDSDDELGTHGPSSLMQYLNLPAPVRAAMRNASALAGHNGSAAPAVSAGYQNVHPGITPSKKAQPTMSAVPNFASVQPAVAGQGAGYGYARLAPSGGQVNVHVPQQQGAMGIEERLIKLIDDRIGQPLPVGAPTIKGLKIQFPTIYKGQNQLETFEIWLGELVRWMHLNQLNGPDLDDERVILLGLTLGEEAAKWYYCEIESPSRACRHWSFKEAIIGLYNFCVHKTTAQDAMDEFNSTRYSRRGGVVSYFNDLQHRALRLVEPPNDYMFS